MLKCTTLIINNAQPIESGNIPVNLGDKENIKGFFACRYLIAQIGQIVQRGRAYFRAMGKAEKYRRRRTLKGLFCDRLSCMGGQVKRAAKLHPGTRILRIKLAGNIFRKAIGPYQRNNEKSCDNDNFFQILTCLLWQIVQGARLMLVRMTSRMTSRMTGTIALTRCFRHLEQYRHITALIKGEGSLMHIRWGKRLFQLHKHNMQTARL